MIDLQQHAIVRVEVIALKSVYLLVLEPRSSRGRLL